MKILYLRTDICRDKQAFIAGGSIAHMLGVLHGLKKLHIKITIFSARTITGIADQYKVHQLQLPVWTGFLRGKLRYLQWRLDSLYSSVSFFLQIIRSSEAKNCQAFYQRYSILNFTGVLLKKYYKIPFILEYNGSEVYWFSPKNTDPWYVRYCSLGTISQWVENINIKNADLVVVVSQVLSEELQLRGFGRQKILVNPNGVNQDVFKQEFLFMQRASLRRQYGIEDKYTFGFIGTFGQWHGINILRAIIPELLRKHKDIHFLLIGDGMLKQELEDYFKQLGIIDRITLTGVIAQDKAPGYLAMCDAYLCPTQSNADGTRFFGSPTKLFEYMSMAKPIIASDLEQVGQVISPAFKIYTTTTTLSNVADEVGFLVDTLDIEGFIRACELCYELPLLEQKKMGDNARAKVIQEYTWTAHVQKIMNNIREQ